MFPHDELRYYLFGLRAGLTNLRVNGLRLGAKKTIGKITQPINAPSRFPEYFLFDEAIRGYLSEFRADHKAQVLDVGSPKLLGLYLAKTTASRVSLTDISELNLDEYRVMWGALRAAASGEAVFRLADARALQFSDATFDVVYSMSVIEHIEGVDGDSRAISEFQRVLKPGGLLVLSVPFGRTYVEQGRVGFAGAVRKTADRKLYFFQRVYDGPTARRRILDHLVHLENIKVTTVTRRRPWLARGFGRLGENARGALGFLNPVLSAVVNATRPGLDERFQVSYGPVHRAADSYGDLVLAGRRR